MWTLSSAAEYLKTFHEGGLKHGYALAIGGGVMRRGYSQHDLDVSCSPAMGRGTQQDYVNFFHFLLRDVSQVQGTRIEYCGWCPAVTKVRVFSPGHTVDWFIVLHR